MRVLRLLAIVSLLGGFGAVVGAPNTASDVQFGDGIACALLQTAELKCWGRLSNPLMQNAQFHPDGKIARTTLDHVLVSTARATSFTLGNNFLCMIAQADGAVECVGSNDNYELGTTLAYAQTPMTWQRPVLNGTVGQLVSMRTAVCASLPSNTSTCWGSFDFQNNVQASTLPPLRLVGRMGHGRLFPGGQMMCYQSMPPDLNGAGYMQSVRCHGPLGSNACQPASQYPLSIGANMYPHMTTTSPAVKMVGSPGATLCSLFQNGQVRCVGQNLYGARGTYHNYNAPTATDCTPPDLVLSEFISDIAGDGLSTCVVTRTTKVVYCWGLNDVGQLGRGDTFNLASPPVAAVPLGDCFAQHINMRDKSVCVVCSNGGVKCWGNNDVGQLGYGHTNNLGTTIEHMGVHLAYVDLGSTATASPSVTASPTVAAPSAPPTTATTFAGLTTGSSPLLAPDAVAGISVGGGLAAIALVAALVMVRRRSPPVVEALAIGHDDGLVDHQASEQDAVVDDEETASPAAAAASAEDAAKQSQSRALMEFYESLPADVERGSAAPRSLEAAREMVDKHGADALNYSLQKKYGRAPKWS